MTHVRLSMKNLGFSIGFSLRETTNTIKKRQNKRMCQKNMFSDALLHQRQFSVFFEVLGGLVGVWNISTFTGTQWFPHWPPPLHYQPPGTPSCWGPAGGHWDGVAQAGQLHLLSATKSPRCSCGCYDLSRHTHRDTHFLHSVEKIHSYWHYIQAKGTSSFTNHW